MTARQTNEVELAFNILQQNSRPMYFRDLIAKVLEVKPGRHVSVSQAMAEIHTQINMDSRFVFMGKGMWGLNDWVPQRGVRQVEESAGTGVETNLRREKLLEEIQQDYVAATVESGESD